MVDYRCRFYSARKFVTAPHFHWGGEGLWIKASFLKCSLHQRKGMRNCLGETRNLSEPPWNNGIRKSMNIRNLLEDLQRGKGVHWTGTFFHQLLKLDPPKVQT